MHESSLVFTIFLIFAGAAVMSTLALFSRQSLLVAYMALGVILGPWCLKLVGDSQTVNAIGNVGIIFLLFLLGLNLPPQKLMHTLKRASIVSLVSSIVFFAIGYGMGHFIGYTNGQSLIVGAAMMFSSTIIGIKLLPTTILHHQHTGETMIGVLLLQDLIAIAVLLLMHGAAHAGGSVWADVKLVVIGLPLTLLVAFGVERFILRVLLAKFNKIREYIFLLAIAWCLVMAELANVVGLSAEIGAFVAGVALAASPISLYISESLKPIRDFFLVMFFFSVGANFDLNYLKVVILPAAVLAILVMVIKPIIYRHLLGWSGESKQVSWEVGLRLGQLSEFSLIIAYVGIALGLLSGPPAYLIQAATIITFVFSSYFVVSRYPTPVSMSDKLRKD